MSDHIIDGKFQSDKYPTCPPGMVPLSTKDPMARDLLWKYAIRKAEVDEGYSDDLMACLINDGVKSGHATRRIMGDHIVDGKFQSIKYPTCPAGKVPLSTKDPMAQDLLWEYALRRAKIDYEFSLDLMACLIKDGFVPKEKK